MLSSLFMCTHIHDAFVLFICTQYTLCLSSYLCVLNKSIYIMLSSKAYLCVLIYNDEIVVYIVVHIYIMHSLFMCTRYILCFHRYICVHDIYYAFIIFMCTQYILCFHRYLCVLDIYYDFIVIYVYSIYIMLSSLFMCTR